MKIRIETKWIESIRSLENTTRLKLYDSIFDYVSGKEVFLDGDAKVAFSMIKPMLDTHRTKPKEKVLFEEYPRSEKLIKLDEWMKKHTPYIAENLNPLTQQEFDKLLADYGIKAMCDMLEQIENRKDHRKKYVSLYRTLLNWLKNGYTNRDND